MKALMELNGAFAMGGLTAVMLTLAYLVLRLAVANGRRVALFSSPLPGASTGIVTWRSGEWRRRPVRH